MEIILPSHLYLSLIVKDLYWLLWHLYISKLLSISLIINVECVNIKNFIWFLSLYVILSVWSHFQVKRANIEHYNISIINSFLVSLIIHDYDFNSLDILF